MKKNKLKLGQKVKARQSLVDWNVNHLCWSYGKLVENEDGREKGERDIREQDLSHVYFWTWCKLSKKLPTGTVQCIGSKIDDLYCWYVEFTINTDLGKISRSACVEEKDLVAVKGRVRK